MAEIIWRTKEEIEEENKNRPSGELEELKARQEVMQLSLDEMIMNIVEGGLS